MNKFITFLGGKKWLLTYCLLCGLLLSLNLTQQTWSTMSIMKITTLIITQTVLILIGIAFAVHLIAKVDGRRKK